MKFTLTNFTSLLRAAMQIGGAIATTIPTTAPIINAAGGLLAVVGIVWGQVNALRHPPAVAAPGAVPASGAALMPSPGSGQ